MKLALCLAAGLGTNNQRMVAGYPNSGVLQLAEWSSHRGRQTGDPTCLAGHGGLRAELRAEPVASESVTCCGQQVGVQQTPSPLSHFRDAVAFEQELWQGLSAQNFPSGVEFSETRVTRDWYSAKVTEPNGLNVERTSDEMRQHESKTGLLTGACPSVVAVI